ncbi:MAG: hypothetical protein JKY48_11855 [Flavobacteriales bacterium]|nr:hypothetical protein [Flavobacteriales bacterium]
MISRLIPIILFVLPYSVFCQSFLEVYEKNYANIDKVSNVSYQLEYLSYGKSTLIDQSTMQVENIGQLVYTRIAKVDSYQLDSTTVIVDHENKQIQLNVGVELLSKNTNNIEVIKNLIALSDKETTKEVGQEMHYSLFFTDQKFKELTLVIDKKQDRFKKMIYVLAEEVPNVEEIAEEAVNRLEIILKNYTTNIKQFSHPLNKYLTFDGKRYALQAKYSTYQFVNNYDLR